MSLIDPDLGPYVCPGCYAVGGEPCAPGCIYAEIEREREEAIQRGDYDRLDEDEDESESSSAAGGSDG